MLSYYYRYKFVVTRAQKIVDYVNMNPGEVTVGELICYLEGSSAVRCERFVSRLIADLKETGIINYRQTAFRYSIDILVPELIERSEAVEKKQIPLVDCTYCGAPGQREKCEYCGSRLS